MDKRIVWTLVLVSALQMATADASQATCPPSGYTQESLTALKAKKFLIVDDNERNTFAVALLGCLASTDPKIRDGIAFEALSALMRGKQLRVTTAVTIMEQLISWLEDKQADTDGVKRPFAALVLSEVARMDRVEPFMSSQQRAQLLNAGVHYLEGIQDHRGFDEVVGWRHGVAHGSDLLLQLAINPNIDAAGLKRMLKAIAVQVAPQTPAPHFYVYGESERLVRPAFFAAQRQILTADVWRDWLQQIVAPTPYKQWDEAFKTQAGLAKRHNTAAFLNLLYLFVQESGDAQTKATVLPAIIESLKQMP